MLKFLREYFTTNEIIKGFVNAIFISAFIFLDLFDSVLLKNLSPFLAIYGLYRVIGASRWEFYHSGFFIGVFWFYWISFSLRYFNLSFFIPLEIVAIAIVYGLIFTIAALPKQLYLRALLLIAIGYIHPFGFNWFSLELTLINGVFEPNLRGLGALLFVIVILKSRLKFQLKFLLALIGFFSALSFTTLAINKAPLNIYLANYNVDQSERLDDNKIDEMIGKNLTTITKAIDDGYRVVVLPESAFMLYLNKERYLTNYLKELSKQIAIVTGALSYEDGKFYNSTYLFDKGEQKRLDKVILVPFGEEIPLPKFIKKLINKTIFEAQDDFSKASEVGSYEIDGVSFTNAICYEATRAEIYKNSPSFVIAISNNAWFTPSTEPTLQRLFIKYFVTKHNTVVYHSVNGSKSEIITPKRTELAKFIESLKLFIMDKFNLKTKI